MTSSSIFYSFERFLLFTLFKWFRVIYSALYGTSTATQWLLYNLSQHPNVQEKIYAEIKQEIPDSNQPINVDYIRNASYLKACFRESGRLSSTVLGNARKCPVDTIMSGYLVPKEKIIFTLDYFMSRDSKYFTDPLKFIPERWSRTSDAAGKVDTENIRFTGSQLGFGPRMCIGRPVEIRIISRK